MHNPHLKPLANSIEGLMQEMKEDFSSLSKEQLNWKPSQKKWSIAECMQHLLLAYGGYKPQLEKKINAHAPKNQKGKEHKERLFGRIFKGFVNPDKFRKVPAPGGFQPKSSDYEPEITQDFILYLESVLDFMQKTDQLNLDLNRIKIASPLLSLIRFNLGDYFEMETMHCRRHVLQMHKVRKNEGYPN